MLPLSFRQHFCCHEESTDYPHHSLENMSMFSRSKHFFFYSSQTVFLSPAEIFTFILWGKNYLNMWETAIKIKTSPWAASAASGGNAGNRGLRGSHCVNSWLRWQDGIHQGLMGDGRFYRRGRDHPAPINTRSKILPQYLTRRCLWNMKAGCLFAGCLSVFVICISGCSGTYYSMHESSVRIADQACEVPLQR